MDTRLPDEFRAGVRDTLPLLLGIAPFALVAGVAGVEAGLTPIQTVGMSVLVFAGASQLAAIDLLGRDAALGVVVLTPVVINLRMTMYSASIAPYFRNLSTRVRTGCAYLLTDQVYALAVARYAEERDGAERGGPAGGLPHYYLGVGATLWVVWQAGTVAGVVFGAGVPEGWRLDFAVPLVFLALLVPALSDRPRLVAGAVAGVAATLGAGLPFNAGLLAGAAVGVVGGMAAEAAGVGGPEEHGDGGDADGEGDR